MNRKKTPFTVVTAILTGAVAACFLYMAEFANIHPDEAEHAHVSWLIQNGNKPYVDFYQPHLPMLWYATALFLPYLPHTIITLILFRLSCVAAFLISAVIGLKMLKKICPDCNRSSHAVYLSLTAAFGVVCEAFRFRPDPFMALAVTTGVYFTIRLFTRGISSAFLAGMSFGIAFILSPKMAFLFLLTPVALVLGGKGNSQVRALRSLVIYFCGICVGISPLLAFLALSSCGRACFDNVFMDYFRWMEKPVINWGFVPGTKIILAVILLISVAAMGVAFFRPGRKLTFAASPFTVLTLSVFLSITPVLFNYNHAEYNLLTAVIPFSALFAGLAFMAFRKLRPDADKIAGIAAICVTLALSVSILASAVDMKRPEQVHIRDLAILMNLAATNDLSCQMLVPFHPLFKKNITPYYSRLYVNSQIAPRIADAIMENQPDIVFADGLWALWRKKGYLEPQKQYEMQMFLKEYYREISIGGQKVLVNKSVKSLSSAGISRGF